MWGVTEARLENGAGGAKKRTLSCSEPTSVCTRRAATIRRRTSCAEVESQFAARRLASDRLQHFRSPPFADRASPTVSAP